MESIFRSNELIIAFCFSSVFLKEGMLYSALAQAGNRGYFPSKWLLHFSQNATVKIC